MEYSAPNTLFHYCSLETFYSIVCSNSIWLSDVSKSNDALELLWFRKRCRDIIYKVWLEYVEQLKAEDRLLEADFDGFKLIAEKADDSIEYDTAKCWTFCLSEKSDDLGQWRGYAADGSGISIGFKEELFEHLHSMMPLDILADPRIDFDRIEYSYDSISELLNDICGLNEINSSLACSEVLLKLKRAVVVLLICAPLYKNEKFAEEKEWRLALTLTLGKLHKGIKPEFDSASLSPEVSFKYDYSIINGRLVSHVAVQHDRLFEYVSDIWLGPKCTVSEREMALFLISKGWLKEYGDDAIIIHKSETSYR